MTAFARPDGRSVDQLRTLVFQPNIAPNAQGSVLACFGETRVICAASIEKKVPPWMRQQGVAGGWLTAEYSMLPYSTLDRKQRDVSKGRPDGRGIEIQRLIGRSLRAVVDLKKLPDHTLWVDCDVLQADGGTRTASITGAYLAARVAVQHLLNAGVLAENPFRDSVCAVSVGVYRDTEILDLNYLEDRDATVDFNVIQTGSGAFVELQGAGEEATFSRSQLDRLLELAHNGTETLTRRQNAYLKEHLPLPAETGEDRKLANRLPL